MTSSATNRRASCYLRKYGRPHAPEEIGDYAVATECRESEVRGHVRNVLASDPELRELIAIWDILERHGLPHTPAERRELTRKASRLPKGERDLDEIIEEACVAAPALDASLEMIEVIRGMGCLLDSDYERIAGKRRSQGLTADHLRSRVFRRLVAVNLDVRRKHLLLKLASGRLISDRELERLVTEVPFARARLLADLHKLRDEVPQIHDFGNSWRDPQYVWIQSPVLGTNLDERMRRAVSEKARAGYYVAGHYVHASQRIALDAGSGATFVAIQLLRRSVEGLNVVTNNVAALPYLRHIPGGHIELTGGEYDVHQAALTGEAAEQCVRGGAGFAACVVGVNSFDVQTGKLSVTDHRQVAVKQAFISMTDGPILFMFNHPGGDLSPRGLRLSSLAVLGEGPNGREHRLIVGTHLEEPVLDAIRASGRFTVQPVDVAEGVLHEVLLR